MGLDTQDLIIFGFNDWETWTADGFCSRSARLVKMLGSRPEIGKIIVVGTPKSIFTPLWRFLKTRGKSRSVSGWFSLKQVDEKIFFLQQNRVLPREETSNLVFRINGAIHDWLLRSRLRRAARELEMDDHILLLANPLMAKHIGRLGEKLSVFDAIDDWRVHPQKKGIHKTLVQSYERIINRANTIFTVSESLQKEFSKERDRVWWVPNGVDVEFFARHRMAPPEFADLPRPIIMYVGTLQERLDTNILTKVAGMNQVSVVLVGPVVNEAHFAPLRSLKNIHFLGRRPHETVPAYIEHSDVCIIPHVQNTFTNSMNPLKLYEYLAAGKPVVTPEVGGMPAINGQVHIASDADAFIGAIGRALLGDSEQSRLKRRDFINGCDWSARLDSMLDALDLLASQAPARRAQ